MNQFTDTKGRTWPIVINVGTIKAIKRAINLDLLTVMDKSGIEDLTSNPVMFVDMLFVICRKQVAELAISDEDFAEGLGGDVLDNATTAFLEEFVDFFPSRKRAPMRKALAKMREIETAMAAQAELLIDSPEITAAINQALEKAGGSLSSFTPQSAA